MSDTTYQNVIVGGFYDCKPLCCPECNKEFEDGEELSILHKQGMFHPFCAKRREGRKNPVVLTTSDSLTTIGWMQLGTITKRDVLIYISVSALVSIIASICIGWILWGN